MENKIFRIAGIAGIILGLGMMFLFQNFKGWIPLVIGMILIVIGEIKYGK